MNSLNYTDIIVSMRKYGAPVAVSKFLKRIKHIYLIGLWNLNVTDTINASS